ncbi:MAG TPA: hypothetical protein VJQ52_20905, partial [Steroidobacteraceae bacterium]|nr:hypothetical protein [Steroidobacteraceae bacterium]
AQVLGGGGSLGGAVNGALGGGLHDSSVFGNANAAGSFGGELDTGSTLRKTRGVADRTTDRVHDVGANARSKTKSTVAGVRDRTESSVSSVRDTSANVAASAAASTESAANQSTAVEPQPKLAPNLDALASDVSGSGAASGNASASRRGIAAEAAADGNASASVAGKKEASEEK